MNENDLSRTPTKARENSLSHICEESDSHVWYANIQKYIMCQAYEGCSVNNAISIVCLSITCANDINHTSKERSTS